MHAIFGLRSSVLGLRSSFSPPTLPCAKPTKPRISKYNCSSWRFTATCGHVKLFAKAPAPSHALRGNFVMGHSRTSASWL